MDEIFGVDRDSGAMATYDGPVNDLSTQCGCRRRRRLIDGHRREHPERERLQHGRRGMVAALWLCLVCAWISPETARAQSAQGTVAVEVGDAAISLRNLRGLDFGTFLPYGRTGTIVLLPNAPVQANNVHLLDPAATHVSLWEIQGTPGAPYAISMPTIANVIGNGLSMSISPLVRNGPAVLTLDAAGQGRVEIGGYLNIPPYITPGVYTGTFTVSVHYN